MPLRRARVSWMLGMAQATLARPGSSWCSIRVVCSLVYARSVFGMFPVSANQCYRFFSAQRGCVRYARGKV